MDIITLAREIGKEIQKDEKYIKFQLAKQNSDDDATLQNLIGDFNLKRMAINNEAQKENRDEEKLATLNTELREVYTSIMQNENMANYNESKGELDALVQRASTIIALSAEGEDPETCDVDSSDCGGNCASCAGCH